jgi:Fe-S-cluster-containing dehydrogenase component
MTMLPQPSTKKLGLVIDLDTCVGCHACAVACKEWNAGGIAGPLTDEDPYGKEPFGVWFNRVHSYEVAGMVNRESGRVGSESRTSLPSPDLTVHFPRSCLHCETPACVTVCPTGASYKRSDGIVLVDQDKCMGCNLCAWACPYGARELDECSGTMKKCTLCVDRIYDEALPQDERQPACVLACPTHARHFGDFADPASSVSTLTRERGGFSLLHELGYAPVNQYLPPRGVPAVAARAPAPETPAQRSDSGGALARLIAPARDALSRR